MAYHVYSVHTLTRLKMALISSNGGPDESSLVQARVAEVFSELKAKAAVFGEFPVSCDRGQWPGVADDHRWRDWSQFQTTADQARIELRLLDHVSPSSTILHVGIGNSRLADRFAPRIANVVGISVSQPEIDQGRGRGLSNYSVVLWNKYRYWTTCPVREFDAIVDNNPTSFACCLEHLAEMAAWYADALRDGGAIFTDKVGLAWTLDSPGAHSCTFGFREWQRLGQCIGLEAVDIDGSVYALTKNTAQVKTKPFRRIVARLKAVIRSLA